MTTTVRQQPQIISYRELLTLRRIAALVARLLIGVILAELAIRWLNPEVEFIQKSLFLQDQSLWFRMKPNYSGVMSKKEVPIATNSWGVRDRELGPHKPGTTRILILGDSLMFGYGVPIEDSASRVLEQALRKRLGRDIEVVNAAVPGYSTLQSAQSFETLADAVQPDIALLTFSVLNGGRLNVTFTDQHARSTRRKKGSSKDLFRQFIKRNIQLLRDKSQLFLLLKRRLAPRREFSGMDVHATKVTPEHEAGLQLIEKSMRDFADSTAKRGVRSAVVIIPSHKQVDPNLWAELLLKYDLPGNLYSPQQPNKRLEDSAHHLNIPVFDLTPSIAARPLDHFYWDGDGEHWEAEGHRVVGEALADFLIDNGFLQTATIG